MKLDDFHYTLPSELIAQHPAEPRDAARLLVVDRRRGKFEHRIFRDLPEFLRPTDVLVLNNTRVIPARLRGEKVSGGAVEVLLLRPIPSGSPATREPRWGEPWEVLVRPARRIRRGTRLKFAGGLTAEVVDSKNGGERVVSFATDRPLLEVAREIGEMPLPPYVREPLRRPDDYQTVYAAVDGAVAAPTAGLHFTPDLLARIRERGVEIVPLTLHIGLGTFRPVSVEPIEEHRMDAEWYEVGAEAAEAINAARRQGPSTGLRAGRVVVIGTSAVRTLETVVAADGSVRAEQGWSELFIYPGYQFQVVDVLVTNFHLPKTTLLMLVCAFAGRELIMRAYEEAVRGRYRFYSFGDAMLIL